VIHLQLENRQVHLDRKVGGQSLDPRLGHLAGPALLGLGRSRVSRRVDWSRAGKIALWTLLRSTLASRPLSLRNVGPPSDWLAA